MFAPPTNPIEQAIALLADGVGDLAGSSPAELGELLAAVQELRSRAELRAWQLAGAFDAKAGWADDGAVSCASWLRHRTGIPAGEASAVVRSGRRLRSLPVTEAAVEDGRLSSAKARIVTRTLTDSTTGVFADQEADLVDQLCDLPAADCATVMRYFQHLNEPEPETPETAREVHLSRSFEGTYALSGTLDAEGGATLGKALDASSRRASATTATSPAPCRSPAAAPTPSSRWPAAPSAPTPNRPHRPERRSRLPCPSTSSSTTTPST